MSGTEGNGLPLPELGISQSRHELSHHNGDPEVMARLSRPTRSSPSSSRTSSTSCWRSKDGDERLLDRTIVLFGSGMSYGHSHGNANLPTVLAGGTALGFKHGKHIDYNLPVIKAYDLAKAGSITTCATSRSTARRA
jgi:hypothetical protein